MIRLLQSIQQVFSFLSCLDHKRVGLGYILVGLFCGLFGASLSGAIRIELMMPGSQFFSGAASAYNVAVTSHGIIMIFFAAMPIFISGFGNYVIPLMVGCRDMALPRLNNLAFFLFVCSFIVFLLSSGLFGYFDLGVPSG